MAELVAKRYAEALFEVALELNKLDDIKEELSGVSDILNSDEKLKTIFEHPKLSKDEKKDIINSIFKDRVSQEVLNFLYITVDKRREKYISKISKEYLRLYNSEKGILEGTVTTAIPLTEEQVIKLQNELKDKFNKNVVLENKIDTSILGGVLLRIEDKVIDSSIKGQLEEIKKLLNNARVTEIGVKK